jgi:hypothetical protein
MGGELQKRKIAFVFYPDYPNGIRLDTMPFARHVLEYLVASGWFIDVFVWDTAGYCYHETKSPDRVSIRYVKRYARWNRVHVAELALRFFRSLAYACVFSVGQKGSYIGGIISTASRCPHVLLNDEFPSHLQAPIWAHLERWSAHRADVIIVPSEDRETELREILELKDRDIPIITVRNSARVNDPLPVVDWHERLGIPDGKKILLSAGLLLDCTQIPELMTSVNCWPQDVVLLLHSVNGRELSHYRKQLSHLENPGRVFWSYGPLTEDMLHSLIKYCDASFGLYRNDGLNTELIGTSSGKIMRSIVCGTPVITSAFRSLDFVTREGVGVQVNHPSEIPSAIINLMRNQEVFRRRCLSFAIGETRHRDEAWVRIVECINRSSGSLNLCSCS